MSESAWVLIVVVQTALLCCVCHLLWQAGLVVSILQLDILTLRLRVCGLKH